MYQCLWGQLQTCVDISFEVMERFFHTAYTVTVLVSTVVVVITAKILQVS